MQAPSSWPVPAGGQSDLISGLGGMSADRLAVGDKVEVVNEDPHILSRCRGTIGEHGTIVQDDGSSMPYRVRLSSGKEWWYRGDWLRSVTVECVAEVHKVA